MLFLPFIFGLMAWLLSKELEINEKSFIFKSAVLSMPRSIPLIAIEIIYPNYVGDSLLYLNIVLTTGEVVKMMAVSDEVLRVLEEKPFFSEKNP